MPAPIHDRVLTELDYARLASLLARLTARGHIDAAHGAHDLLDMAPTLPGRAAPPDLVTMRSHVQLRDETGRDLELRLVYPAEADAAHGHISVLSPLGLSLLGCREGETIQWQGPDRLVHEGTIARILYQPEAAGDYGS